MLGNVFVGFFLSLLRNEEYGMQLGTKVPLWGGFNVAGGFALRLWTPTPKMEKEAWAEYVPALKRAASQAGNSEDLSFL